jgi:hypothetical protein
LLINSLKNGVVGVCSVCASSVHDVAEFQQHVENACDPVRGNFVTTFIAKDKGLFCIYTKEWLYFFT